MGWKDLSRELRCQSGPPHVFHVPYLVSPVEEREINEESEIRGNAMKRLSS